MHAVARALARLAAVRDDAKRYRLAVRESSERLAQVLERDRTRGRLALDEGWDTTTLVQEVRQATAERERGAAG